MLRSVAVLSVGSDQSNAAQNVTTLCLTEARYWPMFHPRARDYDQVIQTSLPRPTTRDQILKKIRLLYSQ